MSRVSLPQLFAFAIPSVSVKFSYSLIFQSFISLFFVEHCNNILEGGYDQWRIPGHPTRDELLSWGIDAFESVNGDTIDLATIYYSQKHSLPIYSGGDIHGPTGQPHAWTTLLLPEEDRQFLSLPFFCPYFL